MVGLQGSGSRNKQRVTGKAPVLIRFLEHFLWAGGSALLVSLARAYPDYWFISLFALTPFLWGVIRTSLPWAVVLGGMLAASYAAVAWPTELWFNPHVFVVKLTALSFVFGLYGLAVHRLKARIGFNAVFVAALWLPLEYVLGHQANLTSLFTFSGVHSAAISRMGSLFGLLMISFVIILVNAIILMVLRRIVRTVLSKAPLKFKKVRQAYTPFKQILLDTRWYCHTAVRGPPGA